MPCSRVLATHACGDGDERPGAGRGHRDRGRRGHVISGEFGTEPEVEWNGEIDASSKIETEAITEGDGDEIARGPGQRAGAHLDRQRLHPEAGLQHLRDREAAEPSPLNDDAQPGLFDEQRRRPDDRLARGGHRHRRGGVRPDRQPAAGHRQQGHRPGRRRPGEQGARRPRGRPRRPPRLDAARDRREGRRCPRASTSPAPRAEPTTLRRCHLLKGDGPARREGSDRSWSDYLGQVYDGKKPFDENYSGEASPTPSRSAPARSSRAGTRASSASRSGSRVILVDPAGARLRRGRQRAGGHQGRPTPCTSSSTSSPPADTTRVAMISGMAVRQERAAAQPAHHAARPAPLRLQGADPHDPLPGLRRTDALREDVRARQGGAAQPRRPDRGRQHGRRSSTTSRATGSAPTSSRCPTSR